MSSIRTFVRPLAVALSLAFAAVPATASAAPIREFEGTVVSVNRESRTFRLNDSERGTKRIKVTRNTRFERIDGFRGLRADGHVGALASHALFDG